MQLGTSDDGQLRRRVLVAYLPASPDQVCLQLDVNPTLVLFSI